MEEFLIIEKRLEPFVASLRKDNPLSKKLRKERELAFYSDVDFIPTEEYAREDTEKALAEASFVVATAAHLVK